MSNLPYPVNPAGSPYPDPNAATQYGQPGSSPYAPSAPPGAAPYPPPPNANQPPYPAQPNAPYGMPPPPGGAGAAPYPNYNQQQPGYPMPYPNAPQNSPYPPAAPGPYGSQPPPPSGGAAPYPTEAGNNDKGPGLFSGKGLLGQAMNQAQKYGGGKLVGQAAGMLGMGGQSSSGASNYGSNPGGGAYGPAPTPGSYGAPAGGAPPPASYGAPGGFLWSLQDKHQYLEIRGNGTEVYYSGRDHQIVEEEEMGPMVRADRPIPRQGMFFFEVSIVNVGRNKEVAVGICTRTTPLHSFPGWDPCSFGYHGDDGNIFCETDADPKYTPEKPFKSGDPIGVALDFNSATLTFYRKQKEIQRIQLPRHQMDQDYYPCIGISSPGAIVRLTMPIGGGPPPPQQGYQQPYPGAYPAPQQPGYQPPQQPGYQPSYQQQPTPSAAGDGGLLSTCTGNKKALLIGINYFGQSGELRGCINDVNNIKSLLRSRGFGEDYNHMRVLTDDNRGGSSYPTRSNIIEGMHWLVQGARPNDSLFFHYSGHGSQKQDTDSDEVDGYDETIVPVDAKSSGQIVDDEMNRIMVQQLPRGVRLTAIFDSCHSATALDLPYIYDCYGNMKKQKISRKNVAMNLLNTGMAFKSGNIFGALSAGQEALTTLSALGNEGQAQEITEQTRSSQGDVVMFAGCKDYQTSADTNVSGYGATGAASYAFINSVSKGGNITYTDLLAMMREKLYGKYSQVIQMSTGFPRDMNTPFIF